MVLLRSSYRLDIGSDEDPVFISVSEARLLCCGSQPGIRLSRLCCVLGAKMGIDLPKKADAPTRRTPLPRVAHVMRGAPGWDPFWSRPPGGYLDFVLPAWQCEGRPNARGFLQPRGTAGPSR